MDSRQSAMLSHFYWGGSTRGMREALASASEAWPWDSGGQADGWMDVRMDGQTDGQNIPCIL